MYSCPGAEGASEKGTEEAPCSFPRGGGGGGEQKPGGHPQENFRKLEQKYCDCKVFLVLEVNELKQVKMSLKFISITFKIMCDVTLVT